MKKVIQNVLAVVAFTLPTTGFSDTLPQKRFSATKAEVTKRLNAARSQISQANIRRSPKLENTRRILASPGSDWGIEGVGNVFNEKRSALTNLTWSKGNLDIAQRELAAARQTMGLSLLKRIWAFRTGRAIKAAQSKLAALRDDLRQTREVWRSLWTLTISATPEQQLILRAVIEDLPKDQGVIDDYIRDYVRNKYGY